MDMANKDIAITRSALRSRDSKTTRSTRHLQDNLDKASVHKASPLSQDRANKDIAITHSALRSRDSKTTTRHIQDNLDKASMHKASPLSQDKANKDIAITRSALRSRDSKTTTRHRQDNLDKASMYKASPLSHHIANKHMAITRSAIRSRDSKTTARHLQDNLDKTSMHKASSLSQDRANKDIAITRSALRIRDSKKTEPPRHHVFKYKTSMSKASSRSQKRANKDIATARSARLARGVRPPSSPSLSNMPATKLARVRPSSSLSPSYMPATKLARVRPSSSPSPSNMPATKLTRVRPSSSPSPSNMPATKLARGRPPSSPSPSNMTAAKLGDISVTSIIDTTHCRILGSAIMTDNRLIIVDDRNRKLTLINTNTNQLMATFDVYTRPCDVSAISEHQAVVTLPGNMRILFVKVTDTIVKEREISVQGICNGMAYSRDRLLVTYSFADNPRLEILDMYGTVIRTVQHDSDGNNLFYSPLYVCVSKDGETVYVSDYKRHTVTSLTLDGVVKAVYMDEELEGAGVCTDRHGNVYVCGGFAGNVHMLTADLKKVKVILTWTDGRNCPGWSISHCQDTNRLFIGMESNTLKSYQLA